MCVCVCVCVCMGVSFWGGRWRTRARSPTYLDGAFFLPLRPAGPRRTRRCCRRSRSRRRLHIRGRARHHQRHQVFLRRRRGWRRSRSWSRSRLWASASSRASSRAQTAARGQQTRPPRGARASLSHPSGVHRKYGPRESGGDGPTHSSSPGTRARSEHPSHARRDSTHTWRDEHSTLARDTKRVTGPVGQSVGGTHSTDTRALSRGRLCYNVGWPCETCKRDPLKSVKRDEQEARPRQQDRNPKATNNDGRHKASKSEEDKVGVGGWGKKAWPAAAGSPSAMGQRAARAARSRPTRGRLPYKEGGDGR